MNGGINVVVISVIIINDDDVFVFSREVSVISEFGVEE